VRRLRSRRACRRSCCGRERWARRHERACCCSNLGPRLNFLPHRTRHAKDGNRRTCVFHRRRADVSCMSQANGRMHLQRAAGTCATRRRRSPRQPRDKGPRWQSSHGRSWSGGRRRHARGAGQAAQDPLRVRRHGQGWRDRGARRSPRACHRAPCGIGLEGEVGGWLTRAEPTRRGLDLRHLEDDVGRGASDAREDPSFVLFFPAESRPLDSVYRLTRDDAAAARAARAVAAGVWKPDASAKCSLQQRLVVAGVEVMA
jgi:hypothetical protein